MFVTRIVTTQMGVTHAVVTMDIFLAAINVDVTVSAAMVPSHLILRFIKSFTDYDECAGGDNNCQQICTNTIGSYTCQCNTGFRLNDDGRNCTGNF